MARITPSVSMEDLGDADMIIEAVFELMAVKKEVFAKLDAVAKPDAILTSNTSYLDVNEIAASIPGRAGNVLGTHFFSPANVMRLVEVVRTDNVSDENLVTTMAIGAGDAEAADRDRRLPRLHRQPHAGRLLRRSLDHDRGRRAPAPYRHRDVRIRHGHGPACGDGSGRARYRLEQTQGCRWRGCHRRPGRLCLEPPVRDGPVRPEDAARFLYL